MTEYVIPQPDIPSIPVIGRDERFPVRRVYCVGRNYAAHIREMGGDERKPPFFFQKPADAIVQNGATVPYPSLTSDFQHEIELVLAIGKAGRNIGIEAASDHVFGLAVGIDLTRRDVQVDARKNGRPWEIGKAFDHSAPITALSPLVGKLPTEGSISIDVNGDEKQRGDLSELIWSCAEVISVLSTHYELKPGDLVYTGTPAGVSAVKPGDQLTGRIQGLPDLKISIGDPLNT